MHVCNKSTFSGFKKNLSIFEWQLTNYTCIVEHVLISIFQKDQGADIFIKIAWGDHQPGPQA